MIESGRQEIAGYLAPGTDARLRLLAQQYHEDTERFDRSICTGPVFDGSIRPANHRERLIINRHAQELRRRLVQEAIRYGYTSMQFQEAVRRYREER